jgi:hypothetical protein
MGYASAAWATFAGAVAAVAGAFDPLTVRDIVGQGERAVRIAGAAQPPRANAHAVHDFSRDRVGAAIRMPVLIRSSRVGTASAGRW